MTAAGVNGTSRAEEIRAKAMSDFTAPSGNVYTVITPGPMHFVRAGFPTVCFLPSLTVEERLQEQAKAWEQIAADEARAIELAKGVMAQCLINPRFFEGDVHDCPGGFVCMDLIEDDMGPVFNHLLERAGYMEVKQAAKAADDFREDPDGAPDQPGGEVLQGSPESAS